MSAPAARLDPDAYARLVERVRTVGAYVREQGHPPVPEVPSGPPRVAPPRLRVVIGHEDHADTWRELEVATTRADWQRAAEALGRRRGMRPADNPAWWRGYAAWHALRRTGRTRQTFAEFFHDPDAGALELADLDDPTPGTFGYLADYFRDAEGHNHALQAAAAVAAALELEPADRGAEDASARQREHERAELRGPPHLVDVLTECVLTAAPPRPSWARVMHHA